MRPVCERSHRYPSVTDRLCKASFHGWPRSRVGIFLCEAHNLVFHDAQLRGRFYGSTHKDLSISAALSRSRDFVKRRCMRLILSTFVRNDQRILWKKQLD